MNTVNILSAHSKGFSLLNFYQLGSSDFRKSQKCYRVDDKNKFLLPSPWKIFLENSKNRKMLTEYPMTNQVVEKPCNSTTNLLL